jgi:hypothetical protein
MEQCSPYGELIKILLDLRCMALVLERIVREDLTKYHAMGDHQRNL